MEQPPAAPEPAVEATRLILSQRWAALASFTREGAPFASMMAYAVEPRMSGLLLFLSRLARHTRSLEEDRRGSLVVTAPDLGEGDPQLLPRVSLQGTVAPIERDDPGFALAWETYVQRLPHAAPRIALGDFTLFRFLPEDARWVGGFGAARTIGIGQLQAAAETLDHGIDE